MSRKSKQRRRAAADAEYRKQLGTPGAIPRSAKLGSGASPQPSEGWKAKKGKKSKASTKVAKARARARERRRRAGDDGLSPTERARQALERNAAAIDATPRGTPQGKATTYRVGRSPSSY